uniref:Uncharacterized protein n=1 Tax=Mycena chlorophos TaxID=658473 RepID=A0ABQ0L2B9_MYCCL|nr:predicted protein [Mycena chlorophos]
MANIDKEVWKGDQIIGTLGSAEYHRKKGRSAMLDRYSVVKLMNVFFARALARRMPQSTPTVIVNTVNPGMCKTELNRDLPFPFGAIMSRAQGLIAFTAEEGSRQLVFAAVGEQKNPETLQGKFIMGGAPLEESDFVVSEEGSKVEGRLWKEVVQILSGVDDKVQGIVEEYANR